MVSRTRKEEGEKERGEMERKKKERELEGERVKPKKADTRGQK